MFHLPTYQSGRPQHTPLSNLTYLQFNQKLPSCDQEESACFYLISLSVLLALFSPSSCFVRSNNGGAIRQLSWSRSLHKNQIGGKKGDDGEWWGNERGGGREKGEVEIAGGGRQDDRHREELDLGVICHLALWRRCFCSYNGLKWSINVDDRDLSDARRVV